MTSIKIDDLETSIELDREALTAISGGMGMGNTAMQGGIFAPVDYTGGGFGFASPTTIISIPVNVQTATLLDNDLDLDLSSYTANVLGSAFTAIGQ